VSENSAVLLHLEELPDRKPPLSDIEAIELYDEALDEVLPESNETWEKTIGQLRWQCVKAQPKNEDLSLKCFQACFSKGALDHARQVSRSFLPWKALLSVLAGQFLRITSEWLW
jgi:N-terminal acetyltransferase B complex non-catalytic subunit